jgi:hypothetical protein
VKKKPEFNFRSEKKYKAKISLLKSKGEKFTAETVSGARYGWKYKIKRIGG